MGFRAVLYSWIVTSLMKVEFPCLIGWSYWFATVAPAKPGIELTFLFVVYVAAVLARYDIAKSAQINGTGNAASTLPNSKVYSDLHSPASVSLSLSQFVSLRHLPS